MQEWTKQTPVIQRFYYHQGQAQMVKSKIKAIIEKVIHIQQEYLLVSTECQQDLYLRDLRVHLVQIIHNLSSFSRLLQKKLDEFDASEYAMPNFDPTPFELQKHSYFVYSVAISSNQKEFLSGTIDGVVGIWNLPELQLLRTIKDCSGAIFSLAYSQDGKLVTAATSDNCALQWDTTNAYDKPLEFRHTGIVRRVKYSSDFVLTAGDDQVIKLWSKERTKESKELRKYVGHQSHVYGISLSHDEKHLASIGNDNQIIIWDFLTALQINSWAAHKSGGCSVEFSHDATVLVSCGYDHLIKLWKSPVGEKLMEYSGHSDMIWTAVFNSDASYIVSAGRDATVRIWNTLTGCELQRLEFRTENVGYPSIAISGDNKYIVCGGYDCRIRVWQQQ